MIHEYFHLYVTCVAYCKRTTLQVIRSVVFAVQEFIFTLAFVSYSFSGKSKVADSRGVIFS